LLLIRLLLRLIRLLRRGSLLRWRAEAEA